MSSTGLDTSDPVPEDMSEPDSAYAAALNAACQILPAPKSDLERLLVPMHAMQLAHQQVSVFLRQTWLRLETLRASQNYVSGLADQYPEIAGLIEQAFGCLRSGERLSIEDANAAFEQAYQCCLGIGNAAELPARLKAVQAQLATIRLDYRRAGDLYAAAATTPQLSVPLQWWFQSQHALVLENLGREFMDNAALEQAIDRYENQVLGLAPRHQRPQDWAATQHHLGNALAVYGQRQRGTRMLEKAIDAFECALSERIRERVPQDWAATQNNLGNSLGVLALRHNDTEMLEASVKAFRFALEERTHERVPHDWATTQNNLAAMLQALGQRKNDTRLLKQSVEAYKNVLQEWTRDRTPMGWATTLNNLGTSLRMLGERRKGSRTLEQSVAAYRSALAERTRERVPTDWAITQNNLGAALQKLAERLDDPQILQQSITAYESALEETDRERIPVGWAMTAANLAAARKKLAELTRDTETARRAVSEFAAVSGVFRNASHARYYELAEEQRASTLKLLSELESGIR